MKTSSTKNSLIIGISIVLGASLLSAGVSNAAGESIKACAKKSNGAMRLIDASKNCKKSERTLTWGTQGDAGATGATGASGANGTNGSNGSTGSSGISYATYTFDSPFSISDDGNPQTIGSLDNLASGDYLMQATVEFRNDNLVGQVRCRFSIDVDSNGFMSSPFALVDFSTSNERKSVSVNYAIENLPGGTYDKIDFHCYATGSATGEIVRVNDFYMSATKVDTLVNQ